MAFYKKWEMDYCDTYKGVDPLGSRALVSTGAGTGKVAIVGGDDVTAWYYPMVARVGQGKSGAVLRHSC